MLRMIARLTLATLAGAAILASSPASASSYAVVSSFSGGSDGYYPVSGMLNVGGIVYGTTPFGGTGSCSGPAGGGCGTIFALNLATGVRTVIHSFTGSDGYQPSAVLINISGILYGTTGFGGASCAPSGCGTVFKFDPSTSTLTTLHSFATGGDGTFPFSGLTNVSGTLYGTTQYGGSSNNGTVYTINPSSGAESVLYSFAGGSDGSQSIAGLTNISGKLYGTTLHGGSAGEGTVFAYDISAGTESVTYSFLGTSGDGANPYAGVINVSGTLYGATRHGGGTGCGGSGCGTVYSLNPSTGTETVVHAFSSTDGANPEANLLNANGTTLYGTTLEGGVSASSSTGGTLYAIDTSTGTETVLHSFGSSSSDGNHPRTSLILTLGGVLYGTTIGGGASNLGTVFSYTP